MVVIRDVAQTVFSIKAQRDDAMENQDPFPIMDKARLEQNRMQKKSLLGLEKSGPLTTFVASYIIFKVMKPQSCDFEIE